MKIEKFSNFKLNESFFDKTLTSEDIEDLFLGICDSVGVQLNSKNVKATHQFIDKKGKAYRDMSSMIRSKVDDYKNFYQFFITVPTKIGVDASFYAGIKSVDVDSYNNMMGGFADHIQQILGNMQGVGDLDDVLDELNDDDYDDDNNYNQQRDNSKGIYFNDASKFKEIADEISSIERKLKAKKMDMYFTGFFIGGTINFFIVDQEYSKIDKSKINIKFDLKDIITTLNYRIPSEYSKFRIVENNEYLYILSIDKTISMANVDKYLLYIQRLFKSKYPGYKYTVIQDYTIRYEQKGNYIKYNSSVDLADAQANNYKRMEYMPIAKIKIDNENKKV